MTKNGTITAADAKRIFRRYWWVLPLSILTLGALGFGATKVLPKKYTSLTTVLVEQPVVPPDYVRPVVQEDLNHHLASMQAQVLSSSRLQPIIDKFNLYSDQKGKVPDEVLEGQLRKAIDVELMQPMLGAVNRQPPGFSVSVTFSNPQVAQQICQEVTSMFMEENKTGREQKAQETTHFLSDQLSQAKAKMDEQDAKLAQFKRQYLGSLPEEEQTNLNLLSGLNTRLEANTQAITRAQQDKEFTQTMLSEQEANWKATLTGTQDNSDTQEEQLAALQTQLNQLLLRYRPEYPDVVRLKAQIEDLQKRMAEEPATTPSTFSAASKKQTVSRHEPANIQQLRGKIKQDDMSIAELTKAQGQIQQQIALLQGRVQASPIVEEQYKDLTRNFQTAQEIYNGLLKNQADAAEATELEQQQESERFQVLDAPSYPSSPSFPDPLKFTGGGLAGGLIFGVGILYLIAMNDKAMYSERDVELCLKVPVLTVVPSMDLAMSRNRRDAGHTATVALKV
jgi:polysaccharide chain length determinant protein (PEP-CTERM system associated)